MADPRGLGKRVLNSQAQISEITAEKQQYVLTLQTIEKLQPA